MKVGDTVNNLLVTATWDSVLQALEFELERAGVVTVDRDQALQRLTLHAIRLNDEFRLSATTRNTLLTHALDAAAVQRYFETGTVPEPPASGAKV